MFIQTKLFKRWCGFLTFSSYFTIFDVKDSHGEFQFVLFFTPALFISNVPAAFKARASPSNHESCTSESFFILFLLMLYDV